MDDLDIFRDLKAINTLKLASKVDELGLIFKLIWLLFELQSFKKWNYLLGNKVNKSGYLT